MRNDVPPVKRTGPHEEPMAGARAGSPGIHTALSVLETIVARGPLTQRTDRARIG